MVPMLLALLLLAPLPAGSVAVGDAKQQRHSRVVLTPDGNVHDALREGRGGPHHGADSGKPFRQRTTGSTPAGWMKMGTPPKWLQVIFDTGSDKLVAKTWVSVAAELNSVDPGVEGLVEPAAKLYNHNTSSTYQRKLDHDGSPLMGMLAYGSGAAMTEEGSDTVVVGDRRLTNMSLSEITADSLQLLHTSKGISGILGLQHMMNRSLGESVFSRMRQERKLTAFGYCRGENNTGTFIWNDQAKGGWELNVIGQMHWVVSLGKVRVDGTSLGDNDTKEDDGEDDEDDEDNSTNHSEGEELFAAEHHPHNHTEEEENHTNSTEEEEEEEFIVTAHHPHNHSNHTEEEENHTNSTEEEEEEDLVVTAHHPHNHSHHTEEEANHTNHTEEEEEDEEENSTNHTAELFDKRTAGDDLKRKRIVLKPAKELLKHHVDDANSTNNTEDPPEDPDNESTEALQEQMVQLEQQLRQPDDEQGQPGDDSDGQAQDGDDAGSPFDVPADALPSPELVLSRLCPDGHCAAILDTGSNIIAGPTVAMQGVAAAINVSEDCSNFDKLPNISMHFGGRHVVIPPENYVMVIPMPDWAKIIGGGGDGSGGDAGADATEGADGGDQDSDAADGGDAGQAGCGGGPSSGGCDQLRAARRAAAAAAFQRGAALTQHKARRLHSRAQSRWGAVLHHMAKRHGVDLRPALRGKRNATGGIGDDGSMYLCMPALVPLDKHTPFGPLWVVGTPLLDSYYARWSFAHNATAPKIHLMPLHEATATAKAPCGGTAPPPHGPDAAPTPEDDLTRNNRGTAAPSSSHPMVRSERRRDGPASAAEEGMEPKMGSKGPRVRALEDIRYPHWAKHVGSV